MAPEGGFKVGDHIRILSWEEQLAKFGITDLSEPNYKWYINAPPKYKEFLRFISGMDFYITSVLSALSPRKKGVVRCCYRFDRDALPYNLTSTDLYLPPYLLDYYHDTEDQLLQSPDPSGLLDF